MRTLQQVSVETEMIYERIRKAEINEVITYSELNTLIDSDVQGDARRYLYTARRWALDENGIVFGTMRNIGIKRIVGDEVIGEANMALKCVANKTGYALRVINATDYESYSVDGQKKQNVMVAALGAIKLFTEKRSMQRIEENGNGSPLNISETLLLFRD